LASGICASSNHNLRAMKACSTSTTADSEGIVPSSTYVPKHL
jgi:hypothetical protein